MDSAGTVSAPRNAVAVADVAELLRGKRLVALTGAGVSTESGIPDYRSPESSAKPRRPIHGPEFVRSAALRQRYWARAMVGWERFRLAKPNASHHALATLEERGVVASVITQNVDRLHHAAGSRRVIELHGALKETICLQCHAVFDRDLVQARMHEDNPSWPRDPAPMAPDGDADLTSDDLRSFVVPTCDACSGVLKPRVVFFGENVARTIVDEALACVDAADALLVAGTSLAVFSGYRFLRRAAERGIPIVILNRGPVRGEDRAVAKIEASTGESLSELVRRLG